MFILAGFIALLRIRGELKQDSTNLNIKKLEKLMAKIGIFSVLFTVPGISMVACYIYEYINMEQWREETMNISCELNQNSENGKVMLNCSLTRSIPLIEIFLLKIFMSLAVGITSGMWIWSRKTIQSWRTLCSRMKGQGRQHRKMAPPSVAHAQSHAGSNSTGNSSAHMRNNKHIYAYQKCATAAPTSGVNELQAVNPGCNARIYTPPT